MWTLAIARRHDVQLIVVGKVLIRCPILVSGYHVGGRFPLLISAVIAPIYCFLHNSISRGAVCMPRARQLAAEGNCIRYPLSLILNLLTPWCRVLLEKLTGLQIFKKFPAFHGTRRLITALASVRHLSLSWASPNQSLYPHPTSWRSILILSTHLRLGLPSCLFPSGFPTKTLYTPPLLTHTRHMPSPSHSSRFYRPHNVG